jgi:hypothetical protein
VTETLAVRYFGEIMVTKKSNNHGLEHAVSLLMQNTALLMQNQVTFLSHLTETRQRMANLEEDIRTEIRHVKATLLRHEQILNEQGEAIRKLPEAIRQKIGFSPNS